MSQFVNIMTFLTSSTLQAAAASLSFNEMRALNAMRCAVNNMGENTWRFLAAAYWALVAFLPTSELHSLIDQYNDFYPLMCTCNVEANAFANTIGGTLLTNAVFSACTEESQILAVNQIVEQAFAQASSQVNPTSAPVTQAMALEIATEAWQELGWSTDKLADEIPQVFAKLSNNGILSIDQEKSFVLDLSK